MKNVLVFPCGSEIGLELARSLAASAHFRLFGASSLPDHGEFVYRNYVGGLPMVDGDGFLDAFNRLLGRLAIDYVFPAHDDAVVALAGWRDGKLLLAEPMTPDAGTARLCRSKGATYAAFRGAVRVPAVFPPEDLAAADFPVFIKPDAGQGGRGTFVAGDPGAVRERLRLHPDHLVLEYLPGREFTVDCFTDRTGRLRFAAGRERLRVANGISVRCRPAELPGFAPMAEAINARLGMRGGWFFQVRESRSGDLALLEVGPRIAGASGFQRARGVNLALLSLFDRMGVDVAVEALPADGMVMDRALGASFRLPVAYRAAYIDLDDTLIMDGAVNTDVVKFVFQCRNRGVRTTLLTRRRDDVDAVLARHRLNGIFDAIVRVDGGRAKSSYMAEGPAVFIDDSFSERAEASRRLGVPAFDPASLDALLE